MATAAPFIIISICCISALISSQGIRLGRKVQAARRFIRAEGAHRLGQIFLVLPRSRNAVVRLDLPAPSKRAGPARGERLNPLLLRLGADGAVLGTIRQRARARTDAVLKALAAIRARCGVGDAAVAAAHDGSALARIVVADARRRVVDGDVEVFAAERLAEHRVGVVADFGVLRAGVDGDGADSGAGAVGVGAPQFDVLVAVGAGGLVLLGVAGRLAVAADDDAAGRGLFCGEQIETRAGKTIFWTKRHKMVFLFVLKTTFFKKLNKKEDES